MKIKLLSDSERSTSVEFNISGDDVNYTPWHPESMYLIDEVFSLFAECFENSNQSFDYFVPTMYGTRTLVPLANELSKKLDLLEQIKTPDDFKQYVSQIISGQKFLRELENSAQDLENDYPLVLSNLCDVIKELMTLTSKCIDEDRVLWVLIF